MRRILIDTHVLLWWLKDDDNLGISAGQLIDDESNAIYVSAVTSWEITIKRNKGLLKVPEDIDSVIGSAALSKLPISVFHGQKAGTLPEHHRDPFDRMLIAQAQAEGLELMTADSALPAYGIKLIDARQ